MERYTVEVEDGLDIGYRVYEYLYNYATIDTNNYDLKDYLGNYPDEYTLAIL